MMPGPADLIAGTVEERAAAVMPPATAPDKILSGDSDLTGDAAGEDAPPATTNALGCDGGGEETAADAVPLARAPVLAAEAPGEDMTAEAPLPATCTAPTVADGAMGSALLMPTPLATDNALVGVAGVHRVGAVAATAAAAATVGSVAAADSAATRAGPGRSSSPLPHRASIRVSGCLGRRS